MRQTTDLVLELPQGNPLRATREKYKTRFEKLLEELFGCTYLVECCMYPLNLLM